MLKLQAGAPADRETSTSDEYEWSGETYEEDKEGAFNKFCTLVQHVPQQCIRYRCAPCSIMFCSGACQIVGAVTNTKYAPPMAQLCP